MTLSELKKKVGKADLGKRVPCPLTLQELGSPVEACDKSEDGTEAYVFRNGYVLYRNGRYETVFTLEKCGDYVDEDVTGEKHCIPYEVFADQPWQVRVLMEGEKRLFHNAQSTKGYNHVLSYNAYLEDWKLLSDKEKLNPLKMLIREIVKKEESEMLQEALSMLNERQKYILFQCVVYRRSQNDVAEELGVTRMNVSISLKRTIKKMRDYFGVGNYKFGINRFAGKKEKK